MENDSSKPKAPSIFIIGAQCTGKTTVVNAVSDLIRQTHPSLNFTVIKELARGVLESANVNRADIANGSDKGMEFQKLVLQAQLDEEFQRRQNGFIISDRSGIDSIAYSTKYGQPHFAQKLLDGSAWATLREGMRLGVVILCEPVPAWLHDDGVRLMPKDNAEWIDLHQTFVNLLQESGIVYEVLPTTIVDLEQRVDFVLNAWRAKTNTKLDVRSA